MAETMGNLNKQYSPQGLVPDIDRPITLADDTFGLHPTTSGARVFVTIPETGFYSFTLNNSGTTYQNIGFQVAICDSNDNIIFSVLDLRNYLSSGSSWGPWATITQSCFLEKGTRITIMGLCISSNGFSTKAYKAKAVVLD